MTDTEFIQALLALAEVYQANSGDAPEGPNCASLASSLEFYAGVPWSQVLIDSEFWGADAGEEVLVDDAMFVDWVAFSGDLAAYSEEQQAAWEDVVEYLMLSAPTDESPDDTMTIPVPNDVPVGQEESWVYEQMYGPAPGGPQSSE